MSKVFDYLNQKVMTMLENGIVPWRRPWNPERGVRPMSITGHEYRGINYFLMSMLDHATPVYLTFNQIKKMGGTIIEGQEKNYFPVYLYKYVTKENDNGSEKTFPIFRYFNVYNIESVDGIKLPKKIEDALNVARTRKHSPIDEAEAIMNGYANAPSMSNGGNRAYYSPSLDTIKVPTLDQYGDPSEYYSTLFHEMTHSTGHKSRLNRKEVTDPIIFGSHDYSREELVAEMGAAMLCDMCGVGSESTLSNSAAYLASWAQKIKAEPKLLAMAAARAQRAVDHITGKTYNEA